MKAVTVRRTWMTAVAVAVVFGCTSVVDHVVDEAGGGGNTPAGSAGSGTTLETAGSGFAFLEDEFTDAPASPGGTGGVVKDDPELAGEATSSFFTAFQLDPAAEDSAGPKFVLARDIDRDGWLDLVTGWNQSQPIQLHLQQRDADGNLSFRTVTLAGTSPFAVIAGIEVGYINDDEWLDVVVLSKTTGGAGLCPTSPPGAISSLEGEIIILFNPGDPQLIPDGAEWREMFLVNTLVNANPLIGTTWHNQFPGIEFVSFEEGQTKPEWNGFTSLVVADIDGVEGDDILVALNPGVCKELGQDPPINTVDLWINPGAAVAENFTLWGSEIPYEPGDLRGQITLDDPPVDGAAVFLSATLNGGAVVPPVTTTATGTASFILSSDRTEVSYQISTEGLPPCAVKSARFQSGAAGVQGPVAFDATETVTDTCGELTASGVWELTAGELADLLGGRIYVRVDTSLRGRGPVAIMADLPQVKDILTLDVDHDGDLDVIATYTNSISRNIRWARNPAIAHTLGGPDGPDEVVRRYCDCWRLFALAWEQRPIGSLDTGADIMDLVDIDNDGFKDVLVRSTVGQIIQWFRQPNLLVLPPEFPPDDTVPDRFDFPWPVYTLTEFNGLEPEAIAFGDLTGDGLPEVIAAAEGAVYWYDGSVGDSVYDPWLGRTVVRDSPVDTTDPAATATGAGGAGGDSGSAGSDAEPDAADVAGAGVGVTEVDTSTHINSLLIVDLDGDGRMDIIGTLDRRSGAGLSDDRLVWYRNIRTEEEEE